MKNKYNYESIRDIQKQGFIEVYKYICGADCTTDKCISLKEGEDCCFGWLDKTTNTIRCCSIDYRKNK
jgi:hypothetical protein